MPRTQIRTQLIRTLTTNTCLVVKLDTVARGAAERAIHAVDLLVVVAAVHVRAVVMVRVTSWKMKYNVFCLDVVLQKK